jgi:hypothetical protein
MLTFQDHMRVSCEAIHVMSYILKVSTIEKVGLELVTSLYHCGCPLKFGSLENELPHLRFGNDMEI